MTGRGKAGNPARPVTPLDPTLLSRPVPDYRNFVAVATGPGAAADVVERTRSLESLDETADPATYQPPDVQGWAVMPYTTTFDEIRNLISSCEQWQWAGPRVDGQPPPVDPTWGFTLWVTAYDDTSLEQLPVALEKCVAIQQQQLFYYNNTLSIFAAEALQRLRLEVIQDQEALENASDDRIRAEFRALMRGRGLVENGMPRPPARNMACIVLDAHTIANLANSDISTHVKTRQNWEAVNGIKVRVLDAYWTRPEESRSSYRGTGLLSVNALARFYHMLNSDATSGAMEDLHPINGSP